MKKGPKWFLILMIIVGLALVGWLLWNIGLNVYSMDEPVTASPADCSGVTRFAVIGDFGDAGQSEEAVAALVDSWDVDYIVTVGDNNYPYGEAETIDANIGQYYQSYIYPYQGEFGLGASENRFFPALGNHDWDPGNIQPFLDYFTLPGNERYYDFQTGTVHNFILDSDPKDPEGRLRDSDQAGWFEDKLEESDSPWKLVFLHHPPYASSLERGSDKEMRWPYARWGATAVIAGHDHLYERLIINGIPYFVNGLGGREGGLNPTHRFLLPINGSKVRYNQDYGAMLVTADDSCLNLSFINANDELIDSFTMMKEVESSG